MRFTSISFVAGLAGLSIAQAPAANTVKSIQDLTKNINSLTTLSQGLTSSTTPSLTSWAPIEKGFLDIINKVQQGAGAGSLPKTTATGTDATAIGDAYHHYVEEAQSLLTTLSAKKGALGSFNNPRVSAILKAFESAVDKFGLKIISSVGGPVQDVIHADHQSLDKVFGKALSDYKS